MGYAETLRTRFYPEGTPERSLAVVLLGMIVDRTNAHDGLGANVSVQATDEFDAIKNAVDCVIEFPDGEGAVHLALAVEVAFEDSEPWDPFDQTRVEIDKDELATVKYFISERLSFKGTIVRVPRVHVLLAAPTVAELSQEWMRDALSFAAHPVRGLMLRSIEMQLARFDSYARRTGKPQAIAALQKAMREVDRVLQQVSSPDADTYRDEPTFRHLESRLSSVFG